MPRFVFSFRHVAAQIYMLCYDQTNDGKIPVSCVSFLGDNICRGISSSCAVVCTVTKNEPKQNKIEQTREETKKNTDKEEWI